MNKEEMYEELLQVSPTFSTQNPKIPEFLYLFSSNGNLFSLAVQIHESGATG